jgi:hypothetical protein
LAGVWQISILELENSCPASRSRKWLYLWLRRRGANAFGPDDEHTPRDPARFEFDFVFLVTAYQQRAERAGDGGGGVGGERSFVGGGIVLSFSCLKSMPSSSKVVYLTGLRHSPPLPRSVMSERPLPVFLCYCC